MSAGRFIVVERPTELRPVFELVDLHTPTARVRWTTDDLDAAEFMAADLSEKHIDGTLPPPYDLPGRPSESPF